MIIMISACLLGINTRYDGSSKITDIERKYPSAVIIPFCPEQFGSLKTPRLKSTIKGASVIDEENNDIGDSFGQGARITLDLVNEIHPDLIIVKENSPSCGLNKTNIDWERKRGDGFTARLLKENTDIKIISI